MRRVSVILLCYNHENHVIQSIQSVLSQDYPDIELVIIDDFSTDASHQVITEFLKDYSDVTYVRNKENQGSCRSFNLGFSYTSGEYIIDLAADDFFLPGKIRRQVETFEGLSSEYGIVFTDAEMYNDKGECTGTHKERVKKIGRVKEIPEGYIFPELLESFFIASPTQMIRRAVLEELNGYDESLSYEDFDFWIRSSQKWKYAYMDEILMGIRKLPGGMTSAMYGPNDPKVPSTFKVVQKAADLVRNRRDKEALLSRISYELRMSFKYRNKEMVKKWYSMYKTQGGKNIFYTCLYWWGK